MDQSQNSQKIYKFVKKLKTWGNRLKRVLRKKKLYRLFSGSRSEPSGSGSGKFLSVIVSAILEYTLCVNLENIDRAVFLKSHKTWLLRSTGSEY